MALAYVQSAYKKTTFAFPNIVFGSALTDGNKIYVSVYMAIASGKAIDTANWIIEETNGPGGTTATQYLLSRTVSGDGTTPPNISDDNGGINYASGVEISGGATIEASSKSTSQASPISGPTTVANNCLGIRFSSHNGGFGTYGAGTGWTNRQYNTQDSTIADTTSATVASGTDLSGTVTNTIGGTTGHWVVAALKVSSNTETGTAVMAFAGPAFSSSGASQNVGTGVMAFSGISFAGVGTAQNIGTGVLAFGGISISALGFDLGPSPSPLVPGVARSGVAQKNLEPLQWNVSIVDPRTGFPSPELQLKWRKNFDIINAQAKVNVAITSKSYIDSHDASTLAAAAAYADSLVTGGTVTSVALSLPTELTVSGSPVTVAGTLSAIWQTQTANLIFAGPTSGGVATPAFRLLVSADIPSLSSLYDVAGLAAAAQSAAQSFATAADVTVAANAAIATNLTSGTLPDARLSNTIVAAGPIGDASHVAAVTYDAHGRLTTVSSIAIAIASGAVSGLAASATTDTTNASNISSGTLGAARLPNPSSTTLGGIQSFAAQANKWINEISTSGVPSATQPAFTDISGSVAVAQLPATTPSLAQVAAAISMRF